MSEHPVSKRSFERYKNTPESAKEDMSDMILMTVEAQLDQVLNEWLDVFSSESNSKVYQEIEKLKFSKKFNIK